MASRGLRDAPLVLKAVGIAVVVVLCLFVGLDLVQRDRGAERQAGAEAASYSPPPLSSPQPRLVSVISDELAGAQPGSDAEQEGPPSWISIVPQRVSVRLSPFIYPSSGYTIRGFDDDPNGSTFVTRAGRISDTTSLAVFVGGAADRGRARTTISKAATTAYADVKEIAPQARVVVVGPVWPTADPPADVLAVRDALRTAAGVADATWVDPIGSRWLAGSSSQWDAETNQPTAAGQRQLGVLMTQVVQREFS